VGEVQPVPFGNSPEGLPADFDWIRLRTRLIFGPGWSFWIRERGGVRKVPPRHGRTAGLDHLS
jgi:hypothetical protein